MKTSYPFWRVTLSNVPSSVSTDHIKSEFAKYGDVHTVKYGASSSSMEVTFKSPKKPNSIDSIVNGEPKYKVTAGTDSPSSSSFIKLPTTKKIKSPTTKISLLKSPPVSKSSKYNTMKFNMGIDTKTLAKNSKLSSSAAPFTSPLTSRVHITNTSKSKTSTSTTSTSTTNTSDDNEGVFFEAVCKSITHETTEEEILDFIKENIFPSIKNEVVKDGVMMLAGESMAVFELNNRDAIDKLTKIINSNQADSNLQFNGNKFTLQRKTNENDVPPPNVKGLSITLEDDDDETASQRVINSNGINVNVVNDKNGSDYLAACYLDYNLNQNGHHDDDKKEDVIKRDPHPNKIYQFDLTEEAKTLLTKQAQTLKIPKSSFVLMLGVLTTNGPVTIPMIHNWKRSGLTTGNLSQFLPVTNISKSDSNKKQDVDVRTNSSPALSSNRSNNGTEPVHLEKKTSFNSNQGSPIGSIGSTPAAALFADAASGSSKRSSPLSSDAQNKKNKKIVASGSKTTNLSNLTKAPLVKTGSFKKESAASNNPQTAGKRMFQYPSNQALNTSSLFQNNSSSNLLTNPTVGALGPNSLISPRAATSGVSLIKMKSGGNATLLSPTAAATLISPRRNTGNPAPVMVPNQAQFTMNNPIGNVTPIHIPGFGNNNNIGNNGQSPINTGFQSPLNYNINTPQSPLSNFITPVLQNTFTPTTNGLNAITPTAANLGFYWNNVHNKGNQGGNTMGNMNMENDPLAPTNMTAPGPFPFTQQSSNPYVQQQLQKTSLLPQISANAGNNAVGGAQGGNNGGNNVGNDKSSPLSKPASTFFKYPIPAEEPKSSPSNSNNMVMSNGVNTMLNGISSLPSLQQQQSSGSTAFDGNQMNMNMMNGMNTNNNLLMMSNNGGNNNGMMQMNGMNMNNMNNNQMMNNMNNNNMNMGHHNNNMMNGNQMDDDDMNDDEQQMDQPPSLDEINNMRSIPSVISPNGTTPVVMITNLNEDEIDCDKIFTLCGVFGDVQRVKISYHKRDTAFVQLSNHRQAKHVVTSLNRMQLYGKMIHVNLSRMTRVKLPKDSPNSAMMFPDAKFLTKDYTNCKKHRYSKKGAGGIKYSPLSIGQPSHILHIANLPIQTEAKDLQEFLCGNGIFAKNDTQNVSVSSSSRGFNPDDKINAIELIGVNNKLGSCQAFAKCVSVDIACQILIDYHSKEFLGREIKISFATRSHMPSDINKTHKTYSYTAPNKRSGSSMNSIPTSIPRQNSNSQPPMDSVRGSNSNNNNIGGGDNMSSSSSNNSSQHSSMNQNNNSSSNNHSNGGYYNNHRNNMDYNSRHNAVCSTFPKNVISNRDSYMDGYNNSVGYQTYVVNKPAPPDQDKIFVRQHHHSGGRKYHYKLRINK